ncbi:hypothetical protein N9M16_06735 [Candidatus Dependentiae bacterium]|nr:hypothetical protein [Candidatus Dependentiae bacterium]
MPIGARADLPTEEVGGKTRNIYWVENARDPRGSIAHHLVRGHVGHHLLSLGHHIRCDHAGIHLCGKSPGAGACEARAAGRK